MVIRHILKDGRVLKDIRGHVVRKEDVPDAYDLIDAMNEGRNYERKGTKRN